MHNILNFELGLIRIISSRVFGERPAAICKNRKFLGFVSGNTIQERVSNLFKPLFFIKNVLGIKQGYQRSFNQFLKNAGTLVKKEFYGKVTYASAMWEKVGWSDFDSRSLGDGFK